MRLLLLHRCGISIRSGRASKYMGVVNYLCLGILLSTTHSCQVPTDSKALPVIHIDPTKGETLYYSEWFDSLTYLPLQQTADPASFVAEIQKLYIDEQRVYIFAAGAPAHLTVFDRRGRFLFRIAPADEGPGAVTTGTDFWVDPQDGHIEILDQYAGRIVHFSNTGQWQQTVAIDKTYVLNLRRFKNGAYVLNTAGTRYSTQSDRVHWLTSSGTPTREALPLSPATPEIVMQKDWFVDTSDPDRYLYHSFFDPWLYTILPDGVDSLCRIDFGAYAFSPEELQQWTQADNNTLSQRIVNNPDRIMGCLDVLHTPGRLWLTYRYDRGIRLSMARLDNWTVHQYTASAENDLDGGLGLSRPFASYDNQLVFLTNGYLLSDHLAQIEASGERADLLPALRKATAEVDLRSENPVLLFAHLRVEED